VRGGKSPDDAADQQDLHIDGAVEVTETRSRQAAVLAFSSNGFASLKKLLANRPKAPVDISGPTNVVHTAHVVFDQKSLSYQGLPQEWQKQKDMGTYSQFGCSIINCPRVAVPGFKERIPAVLVQLRDELERHDGLVVEGVFRVAASFGDQKAYKTAVDTGTFAGCQNNEDVMCMAALIKEWFRTMPVRLLNALSLDSMRKGAANVETDLPEPNLSVFKWLLDLMAETVMYEEKNRMTVKAISIVMAPNLYSTGDGAAALDVVLEMQGAVSIVEKALKDWIFAKEAKEQKEV